METDGVRFGLVGIKNVGENLVENIFRERTKKSFINLSDFIERMRPFGLNKKAVESLVLSGALDCFGRTIAQMMAACDQILANTSLAMHSAMPGQISLFDTAGDLDPGAGDIEYPDIPDFTLAQRLHGEKSACGVYLSGHPMSEYDKLFKKLGAKEILSFRTDPDSYREGEKVTLLCQIAGVTQKPVRSGGKMAFIQAEDMTGFCEVIVFPKVLTAHASLVQEDKIVVIHGRINTKDDEIKILADKMEDAENLSHSMVETEKKTNTVLTSLEKTENFQSVSKIFLRFDTKESKIEQRIVALIKMFPGKTPCYFYYRDTAKLFHATGLDVNLTKELIFELESLLGEENVGLK